MACRHCCCCGSRLLSGIHLSEWRPKEWTVGGLFDLNLTRRFLVDSAAQPLWSSNQWWQIGHHSRSNLGDYSNYVLHTRVNCSAELNKIYEKICRGITWTSVRRTSVKPIQYLVVIIFLLILEIHRRHTPTYPSVRLHIAMHRYIVVQNQTISRYNNSSRLHPYCE